MILKKKVNFLKVIGKYKNGNYNVTIFEDGTKIRENDLDNLTPEFAESCDVSITERCDGGCPMCYLGCNENGKHADLLSQNWIRTLHPYTELAINGNDLSHPQLDEFLCMLKEQRVIANITVNQKHFMLHYDRLRNLSDEGLVHGVGVSLVDAYDEDFVALVRSFPNAVIHTIAGILTTKDLEVLADKELKMLILGYKTKGRGMKYAAKNAESISENLAALRKLLPIYFDRFSVISFDNLAIEQLFVWEYFQEKEKWDEFYMGDDGQYTFYIDAVNGVFARDSMSLNTYPILDNVDDMFNVIRSEKYEK